MSLADDLQKLHTLREQGALTDEEFTLAKKRLLDGGATEPGPRADSPREPGSTLRQLRRSTCRVSPRRDGPGTARRRSARACCWPGDWSRPECRW